MSGPQVRFGTEAKIYFKHLENVKTAVTKTDNKAPRLPIKVYVKEANFFGDMIRMRNVERQNRELLKEINIIYRTKGKTNCQLETYNRKKTMYNAEQAILRKQRDRNEAFLEKLKPEFVRSEYNQEDSMKHWKKALKVMRFSAKYPEFYDKKHSQLRTWSLCPTGVLSDRSSHTVCFLDLKIGDLPKTFRLEIELYSDIVPGTAENFASLCQGFADLSYRGSTMHRIVPGLMCLGGDVVNHSGTGGMSIYGPVFPDENFTLQHTGPGVIAAYNSEPNKNNSQFLITFKKLATLNGRYVVFGRVKKSSMRALDLIESCGTKSGKPHCVVAVHDCGVKPVGRRETSSAMLRQSEAAQ